MRFSPTATFTFSLILCLARSEDHHKRAPSGFTGVRGKKSISEDTKNAVFFEEDGEDEEGNMVDHRQMAVPAVPLQFSGLGGDVFKRAPSMGFVGMRGKKPWELDSRFYGDDNERLPKRAPNGFFGMRGKKDDDSDMAYDLEKRIHSGFFGMRGKKENFQQEPSFYMSEKRAPSMGFVGMRGRKSYDETLDEFEKRAPSGFFGMRGKKQWGQFALRGKKIPYQFRGKFVGVRGKKTMFDGGNVETENYNSDINRLLMQLLEDENLKRTGTDDV